MGLSGRFQATAPHVRPRGVGTVVDTSPAGTQVVNGIKVTANVAHVRLDRLFKGTEPGDALELMWFSPKWLEGTGFAYSGLNSNN